MELLETKFAKITTITMIVLLAIATGLLIYQIFFYKDKDLQRIADIRERELELLQRIEDMKENTGTLPEKKEPAPAPKKEIPLAPPPAAAKIETEEETK